MRQPSGACVSVAGNLGCASNGNRIGGNGFRVLPRPRKAGSDFDVCAPRIASKPMMTAHREKRIEAA